MKIRYAVLIIAIVCFIGASAITLALPNVPETVTAGTPQGRSIDHSDQAESAYGSNVTQLTVIDPRVTKRWQGYYGNVSGIITLDNANNWTMFDWNLGDMEGEIYASNATISSWVTIHCINLSLTYSGSNCSWSNSQYSEGDSRGDSGQCLNVTEVEGTYGMSSTDSDGVSETFNNTLGSIVVGTTTVNNCHMVNLYVNDTAQSTNYWNETILTLNNTETVIYASIVNNDKYGFDNATWDFQMIVGDNGDDGSPTTYYFYVELS